MVALFYFMDIIILMLAVYKLSYLLAKEIGPFGILAKFRFAVGVKVSEYGELYGSNEFASGLVCMSCNSVWIAAVVVVCYWLWPVTAMVLLPIAIGGVVTFLNNNYV